MREDSSRNLARHRRHRLLKAGVPMTVYIPNVNLLVDKRQYINKKKCEKIL